MDSIENRNDRLLGLLVYKPIKPEELEITHKPSQRKSDVHEKMEDYQEDIDTNQDIFKFEPISPNNRFKLAIILVIICLIILIALAMLNIFIDSDKMDDTFQLLVPYFMNIITAVVFFYFGKGNV
jgi:hypothetical protein